MDPTGRAWVYGFLLGGLTFVGMSYVLHCKMGMGPWPCQREATLLPKGNLGQRSRWRA